MDSNLNTHVKVVAVLHILSGVLGLIPAIVIFAVLGVAGGIMIWQGEHGAATIIGIGAILIGGFLAVLGAYTLWVLLTNDQHVLSAPAFGGPERSAVS